MSPCLRILRWHPRRARRQFLPLQVSQGLSASTSGAAPRERQLSASQQQARPTTVLPTMHKRRPSGQRSQDFLPSSQRPQEPARSGQRPQASTLPGKRPQAFPPHSQRHRSQASPTPSQRSQVMPSPIPHMLKQRRSSSSSNQGKRLNSTISRSDMEDLRFSASFHQDSEEEEDEDEDL